MKKPYSLKNWKLTLPVDKNGNFSGKAAEILQPKLEDYHDQFFQQFEKQFVYKVPAKGASTSSGTPPRTELRGMIEFSIEQKSRNELKFYVQNCVEGGKIVLSQYHDKNEPMYKLVWHQKAKGSELYGLVKKSDGSKDTKVPLLKGLKLGDIITFDDEYTPAKGTKPADLMLKANGVLTHTPMARTGKGGKMYPKRGGYGCEAIVVHIGGN